MAAEAACACRSTTSSSSPAARPSTTNAANSSSRRIPSKYQSQTQLNLARAVRLRSEVPEFRVLHIQVNAFAAVPACAAEYYAVTDIEGRSLEFESPRLAEERERFRKRDVFAEQSRSPQIRQFLSAVAERERRRPSERRRIYIRRRIRDAL